MKVRIATQHDFKLDTLDDCANTCFHLQMLVKVTFWIFMMCGPFLVVAEPNFLAGLLGSRSVLKRVGKILVSNRDDVEHARWPGPLNFTPTAATIPPYYPPFPVLYPDGPAGFYQGSAPYISYWSHGPQLSLVLLASLITWVLQIV